MIKLENIKKQYIIGEESFMALKGVDLEVNKGEFVTIMGPSGSGKSTLLQILGCLDNASSGIYLLDGKDITKLNDDELSNVRNQKIGFVFQSYNLLPKLNVYDNAYLPFIYSNVGNDERKRRVLEALEKVQLADKLTNKPNQLSGGQRQRVAIARSLVMNPSMILADEPTGNLDSKTSVQILDIFKTLNKEGATIVMITHEPDIGAIGTKQVHIKDGLVESIQIKKNIT
ncbi:ABC transporter ATP-binding protein [Candidatus Dojkabacteria bacterium]|nr:ABC transporter ATP-binding protein [Candidatus Dojkabacteria bacterium]